ncbi:hypothetical protein D3269_14130 [Listeria monocytogenes]|nr:hypothetical protein [Listeria monocytogenes]EAD2139695.1 hypothetical protein [Listeria monocytogenes]EAD2763100.1 hypothetical protein [Listeria monocytogenes]
MFLIGETSLKLSSHCFQNLSIEIYYNYSLNSDLINERVKIRDDYNVQDFKHYRVSTYDYIIDIIAKDYQLE